MEVPARALGTSCRRRGAVRWEAGSRTLFLVSGLERISNCWAAARAPLSSQYTGVNWE